MLDNRRNAHVEALNGLLQQAKREARGFRIASHFINIAYLRMSKLKHLPPPIHDSQLCHKAMCWSIVACDVKFHTKRHSAGHDGVALNLDASDVPFGASVGATVVDIVSINQNRNSAMFTPVHARAASAYKRVGLESVVNGSDPHQLTQLLFKALLQALSAARTQMVQGDVAGKCQSINRMLHILQDGLDEALDMKQGGAIAISLRSLYGYCGVRLSLANAHNDPLILDEVRALIEPISQAWDQIRPAVQ